MEEKELYPYQKEILEELRSMTSHRRMIAVMPDRPPSMVIRDACDGICPERFMGFPVWQEPSPINVNSRYGIDYLGMINSEAAFKAGMGSKSNLSMALLFDSIRKLSLRSPLQIEVEREISQNMFDHTVFLSYEGIRNDKLQQIYFNPNKTILAKTIRVTEIEVAASPEVVDYLRVYTWGV